MESIDQLKDILLQADKDIEKADKGNKSACKRLRKVMQIIKVKAQEIRLELLAKMKSE